MATVAKLTRLIPGAPLKAGDPRLTTIAVRPLDAYEGEDRYAVLAVEEGVQYIVWTLVVIPGGVEGGETINGTYVRLADRRLFADSVERAFLRALGDWLARA
jgi:hypothetical protein